MNSYTLEEEKMNSYTLEEERINSYTLVCLFVMCWQFLCSNTVAVYYIV